MPQAFACPHCSLAMHKAKGPYDVWYCLPCNYGWDVYRPEGQAPAKVEVDEVQLHDAWSGGVVVTRSGEARNGSAEAVHEAFGAAPIGSKGGLS